MGTVKIGRQAFLYPMPMVIVGADVEERPNFLAVAWVTRTNYEPPIMGISLGKNHYTNRGIRAHGEFSICVPGRDLVAETDFVGIASGAKTDKSGVFRIFRGDLAHAPMVAQCPVTMECRVTQVADQPSSEFFFGEVVNIYAEESCLVDGVPDIELIHPFTLSMPDNRYWGVGELVGRAWDDGKRFRGRGPGVP